ncbi:MAG: J domain-containing protein [Chloroflexota bacterium]
MNRREHLTDANPYTVLGVEPDATSTEIRLAYLQRVREHAPERDPEGFKRVREAYETLRSPRKRAELTLLELRCGPAEFDLDRLHDAPPPAFPARYLDHLIAIALAETDAAIDAEIDEAKKLAGANSTVGHGSQGGGG